MEREKGGKEIKSNLKNNNNFEFQAKLERVPREVREEEEEEGEGEGKKGEISSSLIDLNSSDQASYTATTIEYFA